MTAVWDEKKHRRHPAGSPQGQGGEFAPAVTVDEYLAIIDRGEVLPREVPPGHTRVYRGINGNQRTPRLNEMQPHAGVFFTANLANAWLFADYDPDMVVGVDLPNDLYERLGPRSLGVGPEVILPREWALRAKKVPDPEEIAENTPIPDRWRAAREEGWRPPGWILGPRARTASAWDEKKHPRHPSGTEEGGEFAPKGSAVGRKTDVIPHRELVTTSAYHDVYHEIETWPQGIPKSYAHQALDYAGGWGSAKLHLARRDGRLTGVGVTIRPSSTAKALYGPYAAAIEGSGLDVFRSMVRAAAEADLGLRWTADGPPRTPELYRKLGLPEVGVKRPGRNDPPEFELTAEDVQELSKDLLAKARRERQRPKYHALAASGEVEWPQDWWIGRPPVVAAAWDESKHPRHPSGTEEGGEFAPRGTRGVDERILQRPGFKTGVLYKPTDEFVFEQLTPPADPEGRPFYKFMYGQDADDNKVVKLWTANDMGAPHHQDIADWLDANDYDFYELSFGAGFGLEPPADIGVWLGDDFERPWRAGNPRFDEVDNAVKAALQRNRRKVMASALAAAAWDESKHPRHPRGSQMGGRWREKADELMGIEFDPNEPNPERGSPAWHYQHMPYADGPDYRMEYAEMVPTEEVARFMEYDRILGPPDQQGSDPAYMSALRQHIEDHGMGFPVFIDWNPETGLAHLSEGHHRVEIARYLGMEAVPAVVYPSRRTGRKNRPLGPFTGEILNRENVERHGAEPRLPEYAKPSDFGLPVIRRPLTSAAWDEAKHPRHPAGSVEGGEFAEKDALRRAFDRPKGFPLGEFTPDDTVKFWPMEPYDGYRESQGPFWKAIVDYNNEELAFWFVSRGGSPHHEYMARALGIPEDSDWTAVAGYGDTADLDWIRGYYADIDQFGHEADEILALIEREESHELYDKYGLLLGDYEGMDRQEIRQELREDRLSRLAQVPQHHRRDIKDAAEMNAANRERLGLAASALNFETDALTKATARLQRQYEKVYRRAAKRAATDYKAATTVVQAAGQPQPEEVVKAAALLESFQRLTGVARRALLGEVLQALTVLHADEQDDGNLALSLYLDLLQDQIGVQAARLVNGAQEAAADVMLDAMVEGWSVPQTADKLQEKLETIAPWQATMLARTDLIALGNSASLRRAVLLNDPELQFKTWLSTPDERTRIDHRHAHGQTVPIVQPFTVGGEQLQFPGDSQASDANVINCRCAIIFSNSPLGPPAIQQVVMKPDLAISAAGYDESKHPRHPKGTEEGGEFRRKYAVDVVYGGDYLDSRDGTMREGDDANVAFQARDEAGTLIGTLWAEVPAGGVWRKHPEEELEPLRVWQVWVVPEHRNGQAFRALIRAARAEFPGRKLAGLHQKTGNELMGAAWDETRHPRHPKGTEEGGEFAPKGGPTVYLSDSVNGGFVKKPAVYLRFGDLPQGASTDYLRGEREAGVSVYKAWHDPATGIYVLESGSGQLLAGQGEVQGQSRTARLVTGEDTGESGSDTEDLLKVGTVELGEEVPYNQIVSEQDPWLTLDGEELEPERTPSWVRLTSAAWDESKHPRHPSGSEEGGEFAEKTASSKLWDANDPEVKDMLARTVGRQANQDDPWWDEEKHYTLDYTPEYVYRVMSEEDYQASVAQGWHRSDERWTYPGQAKKDPEGWASMMDQAVPEGTVAGYWAELGYLSNSPSGIGRVVKIRVDPSDGWQKHEQDDYLHTFEKIPTSRFEAVSDPIRSSWGYWDEAGVFHQEAPLRAAAWDESKHPRHPSGTEEGGEFTFVSPGKEVTREVVAETAERLSNHSVNPVWKMTIDGREWNVKNEANYIGDRMRENITPRRDSQRELAAQEVYQALRAADPDGFGQLGFPEVHRWTVTVPGDVLLSGHAPNRGRPFKAGVAEWIPDDIISGLKADEAIVNGELVPDKWPDDTEASGWMSKKIPDDQLRSLVMLDQIIGNQDRHGGNAIFDGTRLHAIDHGLTFPSEPDAYGTYWNGPSSWVKKRAHPQGLLTEKATLSPREMLTLKTVRDGWPDLSKRLKQHLTAKEIKAARARLDFLIDNRRFIDHDDARNLPNSYSVFPPRRGQQ